MDEEAVFTITLDPELRDAFMADAAEVDRPPAQIVQELMKDYLRKREEEKRGYDDFLRRKVKRARKSIAAGKWRESEDVEADFARLREEALRKADLPVP